MTDRCLKTALPGWPVRRELPELQELQRFRSMGLPALPALQGSLV